MGIAVGFPIFIYMCVDMVLRRGMSEDIVQERRLHPDMFVSQSSSATFLLVKSASVDNVSYRFLFIAIFLHTFFAYNFCRLCHLRMTNEQYNNYTCFIIIMFAIDH